METDKDLEAQARELVGEVEARSEEEFERGVVAVLEFARRVRAEALAPPDDPAREIATLFQCLTDQEKATFNWLVMMGRAEAETQAAEHWRAEVKKARVETLREAARIECERCRTTPHLPAEQDADGFWWHDSGVQGWGQYSCAAARIHSALEAEAEK